MAAAWRDRLAGLIRSSRPRDAAPAAPAANDPVGTVADAVDRACVTLAGEIESVTVRARGDTPWLEAQLSDGTGRVTLVWMGRHDIPGIEAGRALVVRGRISGAGGRPKIYNPYYELH